MYIYYSNPFLNLPFYIITASNMLIQETLNFLLFLTIYFLFVRLSSDYLSVIQTLMRMKECYLKMKKNQVFQIIKMVWVLPTTTSK